MATTIKLGQANARRYLSLADAMQEAVTGPINPEENDADLVSLVGVKCGKDHEGSDNGVRFQRCGGGRRIIRRQRRGA